MKTDLINFNQKCLDNCKFAKTILMLLIVLYHSCIFWSGTWFTKNPIIRSEILTFFGSWLNSFHVYSFTLISGYIFYALKYEFKRYTSFSLFIKKKTKRLIIPYLFVSIVWAIPFTIYYYKYSIGDVIDLFLLGEGPEQLWFLLMLFWVFAIAFILCNFWEENPFWGGAASVALYILGVIGGLLFNNYFQLWTALRYMLFFWLGFYIRGHNYVLLKSTKYLLVLFPTDIFLFVVFYFLPQETIVFKLARIALVCICGLVGAILSFLFLLKIADTVQCQCNRFIAFFSPYTMTIYLLHQQIIYIIITVLNGRIPIYLHFIITFIGSLLISTLISKVAYKSKKIRFLLGEK